MPKHPEEREPLRRVGASQPCPISQHTDWCGIDPSGTFAICTRTPSNTPTKNNAWLHRLNPPLSPLTTKKQPMPVINWTTVARNYAANLDTEGKRQLAASLGLPRTALDSLPLLGFNPGDKDGPCFTFPEVDAGGKVIGLNRRYGDGSKKLMLGGNRGLTLPNGWRDRFGPVHVVEGPTDTLTETAMGRACVGRPSNSGGVELLAELFRDLPADRGIIIVGENDRKANGSWPGREGAVAVATKLAELLSRPVSWALTPDGAKDAREWFVNRVGNAESPAKRHQCGLEFSRKIIATATTVVPPPPALAASNSRDSRDDIREKTATEWEPPAPLPTMPPVPDFPLSAFPPKVADYWRAAGESLSCPVDYVAVPGMTLLGAAVGRSRAAQAKAGYAESPLFWSAVFAPPGGTKSPALRVACDPLRRAEAGWLDGHREAVKTYESEMERHGVKLKEWKERGCECDQPEKPRKPPLQQIILDDATKEAAAKVMAENPRGIVIVKDELIGFVRSLNQYKRGKGDDREFWQSAWAGATAKVNRSGNHDSGPLVVRHPFVGIAGMMCPDALGELRGENSKGDTHADGFFDRFLLSFPDPLDAGPETWRVIPEEAEQGYRDVFHSLLGMKMVPESVSPPNTRWGPRFISLSTDGRTAWEEFTRTMASRMNALDMFDPFRGVLSKLRGYGLRFAALLWCLRQACGSSKPKHMFITDDIINDAFTLVNYFEQHAARCLGRGWADRPIRVATRLLAWLSRNPERVGFNRTEAFIALKDKRDVKSSESLNPAFRLLVDHGYLRPLDRPENVRPGPIPETYIVNPAWVRVSRE